MATDSSSAVIRYPASAVAFTAEFRAVTRAESVTRAGTVSETVSGLVAVTGSGQGSVNAYLHPSPCLVGCGFLKLRFPRYQRHVGNVR